MQTKEELYQALCASAAEAVSLARRYVTDALDKNADVRRNAKSTLYHRNKGKR